MSSRQKALETRAPNAEFGDHAGIINNWLPLFGYARRGVGLRFINTCVNLVFDYNCCQIKNFLAGKGTKKVRSGKNRYLFYTLFDTVKAIEKSVICYISALQKMSDKIKNLLVATNNPGKLAELISLLDGLPVTLQSLRDLDAFTEVEETGATFVANARLKASGYAIQTGLPSIADDSGLEVAALDGRPGVLSARYGGPGTSFAKKMALLLDELGKTGGTNRNARFVCSIAVADADGSILHTTEGICTGKIAAAPRGNLGFGYDPLFIPDGFDLTFGELSGSIKGKISHRFKAFEQIIPFLRDFIAI